MSKRSSTIKSIVVSCSLSLFLLATGGAQAEEAPRRIEGPITITSGMLTADNLARTALFEQSVVARTAGMTMYADRMLVHYDRDTGSVVRIDVSGAVRVTTANRVITSQDAVYFAGEEKIVFTGEPRATEEGNVVTGAKMTYLLNEDRFLVESSKVYLKNRKER